MNSNENVQAENIETQIKFYDAKYGTLSATALNVHKEIDDRWIGTLVMKGVPHRIQSYWGEIYSVMEG